MMCVIIFNSLMPNLNLKTILMYFETHQRTYSYSIVIVRLWMNCLLVWGVQEFDSCYRERTDETSQDKKLPVNSGPTIGGGCSCPPIRSHNCFGAAPLFYCGVPHCPQTQLVPDAREAHFPKTLENLRCNYSVRLLGMNASRPKTTGWAPHCPQTSACSLTRGQRISRKLNKIQILHTSGWKKRN